MQRKHTALLFFLLVPALAGFTFASERYIENHSTHLPYFGNGKMEGNLTGAVKNGITPTPQFSFTNASGEKTNLTFDGHTVWVADFFFTRCSSICPKMSNQLKKVQQAFAGNSRVKIISFTCDPDHDTPQQLNQYAKSYNADPKQWLFATSNKPDLYRYARKSLSIVATDGDGGPNDFIHSQNLVLIDQQGYKRGYYDGTDEQSVQQLITDIKKIL